MRATGCAILLAIACLLAPATATAEAPYAPKQLSIDEVLVYDRFDDPPVSFPWELVTSERLFQQGRLDFELVYDVDFADVQEFLDDAYAENKDFVDVDEGAFRFLDIDNLRLFGRDVGQRGGRITLGSPDMEPRLTVDIEPDGSYTRFVVHNQVRARQFEGFVPARVGYLPFGAEEISVDNP